MARLLTIVGLFLALTATAANGMSYDDVCDKMIEYAQKAAYYHNKNQFDEVTEMQNKVEETFKQAVAMEPTEPQAYLNMATYQSNSHQYDEAIANFDKVIELFGTDDSNQEMRFRIEQARRMALYRKFSKLRDLAYDNGEGNTTEAYQYSLQQLQYTPEPHRTSHQVATLEAMLCEYNSTMCEQSHYHFRIATYATFQHVTKFRSEQLADKKRMKCFHSRLHIGEWGHDETGGAGGLAAGVNILHPHQPRYANNTREDLSASNSGIFVNSLHGVYDIVGNDGIILANVKHGDGDCSALVQNGDFYVNLADNLFPVPPNENNNGPVPLRPAPHQTLPKGTKVLSLVHFASTTFYHWMSEALPRLIYFRQTYPDAEQYKLLITSKTADVTDPKAFPSFVRSSLQMLNVDIANDVIGYNGNAGITVDARTPEQGSNEGGELLAVTWDPAPCPGEEFSESLNKRRMCASLTPSDALNVARRAITFLGKAHGNNRLPQQPYVVVVGRGKEVQSRGLNTTKLAQMLLDALPREVDLLDTRPPARSQASVPAPLAPQKASIGDDGKPLVDPKDKRVSVVEFIAEDHSLADALNLFRGAALVVGPHGGAMSNLMGCEAGKTTVLEVGFTTVAAQHYKHMAKSLGLRYRRLVAGPDRNGRALNSPVIKARPEVIVSNAIELLLAQLGPDVAVRKTQIPDGYASDDERAKAQADAEKKAADAATAAYDQKSKGTGYTRPASHDDDDVKYVSAEDEEADYEDEL